MATFESQKCKEHAVCSKVLPKKGRSYSLSVVNTRHFTEGYVLYPLYVDSYTIRDFFCYSVGHLEFDSTTEKVMAILGRVMIQFSNS